MRDPDHPFLVDTTSVKACSLVTGLVSKRSLDDESSLCGYQANIPITKTDKANRLLTQIWYEVLLLYGEERIRWYQYIAGGRVSKSAVLASDLPHSWELDVACFLIERGVRVSPDVFLARHGRAKSLERLKGVQTRREVETIRSALTRLDSGDSLSLGRASRSGRGPNCLTLRPEVGIIEERELGPTRLAFRRKVFRGLSRHHCLIVSLGCGEYLIDSGTDEGMPKNGLFITEDDGTWVRILEPRVVSRQALVRLGTAFEIALP